MHNYKSVFIISLFLFSSNLFAQHPVFEELYQFKGWEDKTYLGNRLRNAGDINGDGYDEIVSFSTNNSKVFLFWGGFPQDTVPAFTFFEMGETWPKHFYDMTVANIDGDSLMELIIPFQDDKQVYIYKLGTGQDTLPDIILDCVNQQVCTGDVNGDGFNDLIFSAGFDSNENGYYSGRISIFLGGDTLKTIPDYTILGDSTYFQLGVEIASGNINNDGYDDIVVMGNNQNISVEHDYIRVYLGSTNFDTQYDVQINDPCIEPSHLGFSSGTLTTFDYNSDGYDDIFVGGLYVYNGSANLDTIPELHLVWPNSDFNAYMQGGNLRNLFPAGDVNNDGYNDLAIGMNGMFGGKGLVHIRLGGPKQLDKDNYIIIEPDYGNNFGTSVTGISDINGDGINDLVIGEPYYSITSIDHAFGKLHFYAGDSSIKYTTGVAPNKSQHPENTILFQNYPNPFNSKTKIIYKISQNEEVELSIYNLAGQRVKSLVHKPHIPGNYEVIWNGVNENGLSVSSGIYFYRLFVYSRNGNLTSVLTKKLVFLK